MMQHEPLTSACKPATDLRVLLWVAVLAVSACTPATGDPPPANGSTAVAAQPRPADVDRSLSLALDQNAPAWLAESDVPSVAVAYIRDGRIRWTRVYGEQATGVPATERTLYNIASLTKPLTAEIILRLVSAGHLSLDEPLSPYWIDPDIANDPRHRKLTLHLALSHQTGFKNWRYQTDGVLRFESDPGTRHGYSGEGYEYALRFTERKLGKPWKSLASEYLFAPVSMTNTAWTEQSWFAGRMAIPYAAGDDEREGNWLDPQIQETPSAADDVFTTIGDYAAFLVSVMQREKLSAEIAAQRDTLQVNAAETTAGCDAQRVSYCPVRGGAGLGWEILEFRDGKVMLHTGGDHGTQTMVFWFTDRRDGAVLFTNGDKGFQVMIPATALLFDGTDLAAFALSKR
jgi:CubicO group peptidase (beta-lactamase class C family)